MAREARELEERAKQAAIEDQQVIAQLLTHQLLYNTISAIVSTSS